MYNIENRVIRITKTMQDIGYNQMSVARMVGIPQPTLSQLLNLDRVDRKLKRVEDALEEVWRTEDENNKREVRGKVINRITRDLLGLAKDQALAKLRNQTYQAELLFEYGLNELELHVCVENVEDLICGQ